jgi:D-arabinono-1,4-lactone oxidase
MRDMSARPHYAKNFMYTSSDYMRNVFGDDLVKWTKIRNEADPEGMFLGEWHRRALGLGEDSEFALEEREVSRTKASNGGQVWVGEISNARSRATEDLYQSRDKTESPSASSSGESFDMMHGAEAEKSTILNSMYDDGEDDGELTDRGEYRYHPGAKETITGTAVFHKM